MNSTATPSQQLPDANVIAPAPREGGVRRGLGAMAFWIVCSYVADAALIATWGWAQLVSPFAWVYYGAGSAVFLSLFFWSARRVPSAARAKPMLHQGLRVFAVGMQLVSAWLIPPLAFYFLSVVIMTLGFSYRRPRLAGPQALTEALIVGGASVAIIVELGARALPPLHGGTEWLVASGVALTMFRAALFGYWANAVRGQLNALNTAYRNLNRILEQQVENRTAELRHRNAALEQANRRLQDIATAVAHDLRQPLISIGGHASAMSHESPTDVRARANRIQAGIVSMERICEGLLRLIQAETRELAMDTVDVSRTAEQIARQLDTASCVRWSIEPGVQARGDRAQLRTALEVLLANAMDAASTASEPAVSLRARHVDGFVELEVRDNGDGFAPEQAERLFEPFQRLHADPRYDGSGISLALARAIAQRHRGSLWACAVPGEGACFTLALPSSP